MQLEEMQLQWRSLYFKVYKHFTSPFLYPTIVSVFLPFSTKQSSNIVITKTSIVQPE